MAEKQDMPMNGFKIASDSQYVYVELADGSQGKIRKSDLFSILFQNRGNSSNPDNSIESGVYGMNTDGGITSNSPVGHGILLVFRTLSGSAGGGSPIVQIAINYQCTSVKVRARWVNDWSVWKTITLT